jgi:hypothetical protein
MSVRPSGVLAIGAVTGACWVLFVTEAVHLAASAKLVGGVAGLFVIFASTITIWLAMMGLPIPWIRGINDPPQERYVRPRRDEDQEYLRRRAEDARMRDLMNPGDKKAPPTDWFGR